MLDIRYLHLHQALGLGPLWLKQGARLVIHNDTNPSTQPKSGQNKLLNVTEKQTNEHNAPSEPNLSNADKIIEMSEVQQHALYLQKRSPTEIKKQLPAHHAYAKEQPTKQFNASPQNHEQASEKLLKSTISPTHFDLAQLSVAIQSCQQCSLYLERRQPILGQGNQPAKLLIISPNPSPEDDRHNQIFSGEIGKLLENMLFSIGLNQNDVYYSSQVKCTPNISLHVQQSHIESCQPYLNQQIQEIKPSVVLLLGQETFSQIAPEKLSEHLHHLPYVIIPHPARLLRQNSLKSKAWQGLKELHRLLLQTHHTPAI